MSKLRIPNRSEAQREASRLNAQSSTGPRTDEGKTVSSRNAYKHGFTAVRLSAYSEQDAALLKEICDGYDRELRPVGYIETDLVRRIADESFRLRIIEQAIDDLRIHGIARARKLSHTPAATGTLEDAFVVALADPEYQHRLSLLLRYKSGSERAFYRAFAELRRLQKERRAEDQASARPEPRKTIQRPDPGFVSPPYRRPILQAHAQPISPPESPRK